EKTYAAGKIPGGFFKREARQRESEILACRIMDRPIRPLFADGFKMDTQLIGTVMSSDGQNKADVLALTGAAACVHLSQLPWEGPIMGLRVGRVDGKLIANPTLAQLETSDMDVIIACSRDAIVMVEGGGLEISEGELADALEFGHEAAQPVLDLVDEMRAVVGKDKMEFQAPALDAALAKRVSEIVDGEMMNAAQIRDKHQRYAAYDVLKTKMVDTLKAELGEEKYGEHEKLIKEEFGNRKYELVRDFVLTEKKRIDGRGYSDIRNIATEAGLLKRTHGSALFQRGETQAIATTTLGTTKDEQKIDGIWGDSWSRFYLHYNFPPFCTGETKFLRGPSRREIGHGALAQRAIEKIIPAKEDFPYTIRLVSEITESNGSSSMA
ncbi:MAG: polyribonucleotide nucleotidyltransferase, partial [Myxococcales bacterium]|nr:polyribonucleotide nucleotidyltransferase [Myxococcales bacterium]